ncbi:UNVERIFIED_CONTAM: hypothetical protein FKN15_073000, partial [Acipenser sinensis]
REFYATVRNKEGQQSGISSYISLRAGIHRHLTSPPYCKQINIQNCNSSSANNVFTSITKQLRRECKDESIHRPAITGSNLTKVTSSNVLNTNIPHSFAIFIKLFRRSLHQAFLITARYLEIFKSITKENIGHYQALYNCLAVIASSTSSRAPLPKRSYNAW